MIAAVVIAVLVLAGLTAGITVIRNIYVCPPNEVLVFSGRRWPVPGLEGKREVGFRLVRGGRTMRMPVIEVVDRMSLTNMAIELAVQNAFSRGGVPLNVQAIANVKFPSEEPLLHNALERFMGRSRNDIALVAKDTLEGNLRGVIAELSPEEINQQKVMFQQKLIDEAERDMHRMGLLLDNLQIQNISDGVGYLTSVGRARGAQVRRSAKIGEIKAQADALVKKAETGMASEIARVESEMLIAQKEAERRIIESQTNREALVAEARGEVSALVAEARAQLPAWEARIEQARLRLEADVVAPAQAYKQQAEEAAKGKAAQTLAQGRAAAQALSSLAAEYGASGARATDALLLQKLVPIFELLTSTLVPIDVGQLTILGAGAQAGSGSGLAPLVLRTNEQIRAATGVDLLRAAASLKATSPEPEPPADAGAETPKPAPPRVAIQPGPVKTARPGHKPPGGKTPA